MTKFCYEYPRPAVTVDVVAISNDWRILLVKRKAEPYQGCWALPGGFIDIDETLEHAAARELEEETGVSGLELGQLRAFDRPDRDPRGRNIAVAFLALINNCPSATAGDDAAEAQWVHAEELPPLAFDHAEIIDCALAKARRERGAE